MTYMGRASAGFFLRRDGVLGQGQTSCSPRRTPQPAEPSRCLSRECGAGLRQAFRVAGSEPGHGYQRWSFPVEEVSEAATEQETRPPPHLLPQHLFSPPTTLTIHLARQNPHSLETHLVLFAQLRAYSWELVVE